MRFDSKRFVSSILFIVGSLIMVVSLLAGCVLQSFVPFALSVPGGVAVAAGRAMD